MPDPHAAAVRQAERTNAALAVLFARTLGSSSHPRGAVLSAYRAARRALAGRLDDPAAVADALGTLRRAVEAALAAGLRTASDIGLTQALRELELYEVTLRPTVPPATREATAATLATLEAQLAAVRGLIRTSGGEALILGDGARVGVLSPGPVLREGARWLAVQTLESYEQATSAALADQADEYRRQAIAALDERTTETCLKVHGQVVGLDEPFVLTGTPRYADEMHKPPFHMWCRTSTALVRAQNADDTLSRQMRDAARAELTAREATGERQEIHPAHARSRRA